ncbi:hypothetical protein BV22DRAFT_1058690 [Leucogyrophana mollusca]|uniref:Uncharacterized protein n=1 Tax=Leucogyrophana mollusca TaxID=85980 RepID=A0ACB8BTJ3_9AGAM|nr:hypothetical protein BV22DRAFT_1058690 [Leucogyrophana mollusca]
MPPPLSSQERTFSRPQDFSRRPHGRGWSCTLCTPKYKNQFDFPSLRAALQHESLSPEHTRHVSEFEWWKRPDDDAAWETHESPPLTYEGLRVWEKQTHVDHVFDLVPFWQRAVDAAERGEVLRLEEFLEKMEGDGGWRTADDVWGMLGPWGSPNAGKEVSGAWGKVEDRTKPDHGWWGRGDWSVSNNDLSVRQDDGAASGSHKWETGLHHKPTAPQKSSGRTPHGIHPNDATHLFVEDIARQEAADEARRRRMYKFYELPTEQKVQKIQEMIQYLHANPPSL